jgi:hypothetical protein
MSTNRSITAILHDNSSTQRFTLWPKMAPSYTPGQRTSISQFVSFTQSKESIAAKVRVFVVQNGPSADHWIAGLASPSKSVQGG